LEKLDSNASAKSGSSVSWTLNNLKPEKEKVYSYIGWELIRKFLSNLRKQGSEVIRRYKFSNYSAAFATRTIASL